MYIGTKKVKSCYVGSLPVKSIYLGSQKVWDNTDNSDTVTLTINITEADESHDVVYVYIDGEELAYIVSSGTHSFKVARGAHIRLFTEGYEWYPVTISNSDFTIYRDTTVDVIMPLKLVVNLEIQNGISPNVVYELQDDNGDAYKYSSEDTTFWKSGTYTFYIPPGSQVNVIGQAPEFENGWSTKFSEGSSPTFVMNEESTLHITTEYTPNYEHLKYRVEIDDYNEDAQDAIEIPITFLISYYGDIITKTITIKELVGDDGVVEGFLCDCTGENSCTCYDTNNEAVNLEEITVENATVIPTDEGEQFKCTYDAETNTFTYTINIRIN